MDRDRAAGEAQRTTMAGTRRAAHRNPAGEMGGGRRAQTGGGHGVAGGGGPGGVGSDALVDGRRLQRPETGLAGLGTDEEARSRTGAWVVAGDGGRDEVDGASGKRRPAREDGRGSAGRESEDDQPGSPSAREAENSVASCAGCKRSRRRSRRPVRCPWVMGGTRRGPPPCMPPGVHLPVGSRNARARPRSGNSASDEPRSIRKRSRSSHANRRRPNADEPSKNGVHHPAPSDR